MPRFSVLLIWGFTVSIAIPSSFVLCICLTSNSSYFFLYLCNLSIINLIFLSISHISCIHQAFNSLIIITYFLSSISLLFKAHINSFITSHLSNVRVVISSTSSDYLDTIDMDFYGYAIWLTLSIWRIKCTWIHLWVGMHLTNNPC